MTKYFNNEDLSNQCAILANGSTIGPVINVLFGEFIKPVSAADPCPDKSK